jgi:uncharacterized protein
MTSLPSSPGSPSSPEDNPPRPWNPAQESAGTEPNSTQPEPTGNWPIQHPTGTTPSGAVPAHAPVDGSFAPSEPSDLTAPQTTPAHIEPPRFEGPRFETVDLHRPDRIPNLGHLVLLLVLVGFGALFAGVLSQLALHNHLFGITNLQDAMTDVHYALGSEAILYLAALAACLIVFPLVWQKGFFSGIQWNFLTAWRLRWRLVAAAFACFVLALLNTLIVPGPSKTPIEKIFHTPGAAWLLFGFGVTFAPFFEETFFRGFLLPAFCTCYDWIAEHVARKGPDAADFSTDLDGHVRWPMSAQITAAIITAIPFAGLCAFPRSHDIPHIALRVLIPLAWLGGIGLAWLLADRRPAIHSASTSVVDGNQHPVWSVPAMILVSLYTSIAFALMHGEQTAYSLGPFLLLVGVSLVLSAVRLGTRSLAASTLVHASYNFMLFFIMAVGTHGFRHMDKM